MLMSLLVGILIVSFFVLLGLGLVAWKFYDKVNKEVKQQQVKIKDFMNQRKL